MVDTAAPFVVTSDAGIDGVCGVSADRQFFYLARDELGLQILHRAISTRLIGRFDGDWNEITFVLGDGAKKVNL